MMLLGFDLSDQADLKHCFKKQKKIDTISLEVEGSSQLYNCRLYSQNIKINDDK